MISALARLLKAAQKWAAAACGESGHFYGCTHEEAIEDALAAVAKREPERSKRFNETTGAVGYWSAKGSTGAYEHPDRCICQKNDPTPHKHYPDPPFSCARCGHISCPAYKPAVAEAEPQLGPNDQAAAERCILAWKEHRLSEGDVKTLLDNIAQQEGAEPTISNEHSPPCCEDRAIEAERQLADARAAYARDVQVDPQAFADALSIQGELRLTADEFKRQRDAARAAIWLAEEMLEMETLRVMACPWCVTYRRRKELHHADCRFGQWLALPAVKAATGEKKP